MHAQSQQTDPLLDDRQAAQYLGVKPTTLQVWRSTGRYPIEHLKIGRLVRYRRSALDAWLAARTVKPAGAA